MGYVNTQKRKEPVLDGYVKASVVQANGKRKSNGRYATLILKLDSDDFEHAKEMRNALYRSAYHLGLTLDAEIISEPRNSSISRSDYQIVFTAVHPGYKERWSALEAHKRKLREAKKRDLIKRD